MSALRLTSLSPTQEELEEIERFKYEEMRADYGRLLGEFIYIPGSSIWPSGNPADSPFDAYKCRHCNWTFEQRMNGQFSREMFGKGIENVHRRMGTHLKGCKVFKGKCKHEKAHLS